VDGLALYPLWWLIDSWFIPLLSEQVCQIETYIDYHVTIQPLGNLTSTFRGAVHLEMTSEPSEYGKRRSSLMQPE
jgi:hypothetical protein